MNVCLVQGFALVLVLVCANSIGAQVPPGTIAGASTAVLALPPGIAGAAPPSLPSTVARDDQGHVTVRAVRLSSPLRVDGALDEELYRSATPISDFIQVDPRGGEPATEKTEVWIAFDSTNVYVAMRAHESQPERMIVNEMRRDSFNLFQNENFQFAFDTFFDRRNSVSFQFNPLGGRMDGQVTNESQFNADWNPLWRLQVRRQADGWTAEAAIPFKSLRYKQGSTQLWGFQARRISRWKNEISYLTLLPRNVGNNGHARVSLYAPMIGLELPQTGTRVLDLKPYVTSSVTTDRNPSAPLDNVLGKNAGLDVKYSLTQNMTADLTVNTDFAQVEADEQQVNLTRFSLFFPEKREFFLENQGLFQFASGGANNNNQTDTPTLFYSRRIGLDSGVQIPIDAGGRVSGRIGRYSLGVMNIQTGDLHSAVSPTATNFSVARLRTDVLRRSAIGAIFTRRSRTAQFDEPADTIGLDGSFNFYQNISFNTHWAVTENPGVSGGGNTSYRGQGQWNADRWGIQGEFAHVGDNFDPQVGFVRRDDFTKGRMFFRFSPRPRTRFRSVRKFSYQGFVNHYADRDGRLVTRDQNLEFNMEFNSSDRLTFQWEQNYELLLAPFNIASGVVVAPGSYRQKTLTAEFQIGQQRNGSGTWWVETGPFYSGDRTAFGYRAGRVRLTPQVALEPTLSVNKVSLPFGDFTTTLLSTRATFTIKPLMFVSGLVQYNSSNNSLSTNVRLRWEYQPGSELFVVYNDGRDTTGDRFATLQNRALVVKINRLFRY